MDMKQEYLYWPTAMDSLDKDAYLRAGFGHTIGFGNKPALLIIDVQERTVGPRKPVVEAIQESYPTACGERAWAAIDAMTPLVALARSLEVPVYYPSVSVKASSTIGTFGRVNPLVGDVDLKGYDFIPQIAPQDEDVVIPKQGPSSFFGTPLAAYLINQGIDTVILVGCTTSGCVRASAVDAFSLNFRTIVVADAVYDRSALSHEVSLFELSAKYADVLTSHEVSEVLHTLRTDS